MKKVLYALTPALLAPMSLFADAAPAAGGNNMMRTLSLFGVVLVFFYLILWRPEQKRRKKMQSLKDSLKPGDQITAMGIVAEIAEIRENTVILKVDGAKIEMLKAAVSEVHAPAEAKVKVKEKAPAQEPEPVQS